MHIKIYNFTDPYIEIIQKWFSKNFGFTPTYKDTIYFAIYTAIDDCDKGKINLIYKTQKLLFNFNSSKAKNIKLSELIETKLTAFTKLVNNRNNILITIDMMANILVYYRSVLLTK